MGTSVARDPDREFWVGMRNTYIQQIRLIRERFGAGEDNWARAGDAGTPGTGDGWGGGEDGALVGSVCAALGAAVRAIEGRWGLHPRI